MEYEELRGYRFSKLALGTVALGLDYGISNQKGKPGKTVSSDIIATALSSGINTLDTARDYGDAELLIGNFLKQSANTTNVNLVTKFRIGKENLSNPDRVRVQVYDSVTSSLNFLGLKRIPICLLHKTIDEPMDQVMKVLPGVFESLKEDGLIDLAGISVNHPDEAEEFLQHPVMDVIQVPVNVFDQRIIRNGLLARMQKEKKIVFARSVFLQGLFFMETENLSGKMAIAGPFIEKLRELALQADRSVAELAFSYVNGLNGITSMVFGAVSPQQVLQNVQFLKGMPVPHEVEKLINELFTDVPELVITPGLWNN
ncbi:aldo/keto reductase [Pedobacter heparinus]|uniref:aldo/keto reductase n=1 Tax=Pedobacter heparinus TaxID=984 RepID=UPI00292FBE27|nr:aldo/keto reductase [Pedobacter heparinus]